MSFTTSLHARAFALFLLLTAATASQASEAPLIDTISSGTVTAIAAEDLEAVPGARDFVNLAGLVPTPTGGNKIVTYRVSQFDPGRVETSEPVAPTNFVHGLSNQIETTRVLTSVFSACSTGSTVAFISQQGREFLPLLIPGGSNCFETQIFNTNRGTVVAKYNLSSRREDFYLYDESIHRFEYAGTFPTTGQLGGNGQNWQRIAFAVDNERDDLYMSALYNNVPTLFRLDARNFQLEAQVSLPYPAPAGVVEQDLVKIDDAIAGLTIDGNWNYRLWTYTIGGAAPIFTTTVGEAPSQIIDGLAMYRGGDSTLYLSTRTREGDGAFHKIVLDLHNQLRFHETKVQDFPTPSGIQWYLPAAPGLSWDNGNTFGSTPQKSFFMSQSNFSILRARYAACTNTSTRLCNNDDRFAITATYRTSQGASGQARPIPLTNDTGYFWFFNQENVELMIKALNGCTVNSRYWIFAGGLTDVEVNLEVLDTVSGARRSYRNGLGQPFQLIRDTGAFAGCAGGASNPFLKRATFEPPRQSFNGSCVASDTALCLQGNRFRLEASWQTPDGRRGSGRPVRLTEESGYFWFFDAANVELVTKVLNACSFAQRHWVFTAGLTDVAVEMSVTDTTTGAVRRYQNAQGVPFQLVRDTAAFSTCP